MSKYQDVFIATTDTVVGIGAPISQKNKQAIFDLKQRPKHKALITMVGSFEQAKKLPKWNAEIEKLANQVWPGAVTLVIDKETAVRMPKNIRLCEFIEKIGPIYMTSANISGDEPYSLAKAKEVFADKIDHFYDFGPGSGKPSTIIDVTTGKVYR